MLIYIIGKNPLTNRLNYEKIKYEETPKFYRLFRESDILGCKSIPKKCDQVGCEYKDAWYTFNEQDAKDYWEAQRQCM